MNQNESEIVQNWVRRTINDPLTKILLENSHFSEKQLEVLLIDISAEGIIEKKVTYVEKAAMRSTRKNLTRGAFAGTLRQAQRNMTKSIFTILLMGYLGLLETPKLSPFLDAADKLDKYVEEYNKAINNDNKGLKDNNRRENITNIQKELKITLYGLIAPKKNLL